MRFFEIKWAENRTNWNKSVIWDKTMRIDEKMKFIIDYNRIECKLIIDSFKIESHQIEIASNQESKPFQTFKLKQSTEITWEFNKFSNNLLNLFNKHKIMRIFNSILLENWFCFMENLPNFKENRLNFSFY